MHANKSPTLVKLLIIVVVVSIVAILFIPLILHSRSKAPLRTEPGAKTVLRQVTAASSMYWQREGKSPSSLNDLFGISVLNSDGVRVRFSEDLLLQELGGNISTLAYFPRFMALETTGIAPAEIILAYVAATNSGGYCDVVFRDRRVHRMKIVDAEKRVKQLDNLVRK